MTRIALVVSDVDGTLVTKDKVLTDAAKGAVRRLHDAGIGFTIVSSRPTHRHAVSDRAAGDHAAGRRRSTAARSSIPQLKPIEQHLIPASGGAAQPRRAERIRRRYLAVHQRPLAHPQPDGEYVPHEKRAIRADPTIVDGFRALSAGACKIVGASSDAALLQRCEAAMQKALGARGHRGAFADLLSRHHPARPRQGHVRRRRWPSVSAFRPMRSPPSATCRTICAMFARKRRSRSRWATPPTTSRSQRDACHDDQRGAKDLPSAMEMILKPERGRIRQHHAPDRLIYLAPSHFDRCIAGFSLPPGGREIVRGVDQRDVGQGLREVAGLAPGT